MLAALSCAAGAAIADPAKNSTSQCLYVRNITNFNAVDNQTLYVRVGVNQIFRFDLFKNCLGLTFRQSLTIKATGASPWICSPLTARSATSEADPAALSGHRDPQAERRGSRRSPRGGETLDRSGQPLGRSHLTQTRGGALEFKGLIARRIDQFRLGRRQHNEARAGLVERVHQRRQTSRLITLVRCEARHSFDEYGLNLSAIAM